MSSRSSTPFFHGFHHFLFGRPPRSASAHLARQRSQLAVSGIAHLQNLFTNRLPDALLLDSMHLEGFRERIFSAPIVFWAFLSQVLSPASPCREALGRVQALFSAAAAAGLPSSDTSGYCQARLRLPEAYLQEIHTHVADSMEAAARMDRRWKGRVTRVVDGTGISMPDTPENQELYPQPSNQKPGCGFPVMKIVGLFSLVTGALMQVAKGSLRDSEHTLFRQLWQFLQAGEVLVADRGFCSFYNIAMLLHRGVDVLLRNHEARRTDFRKGKRLGRHDHLVIWKKPRQPIAGLTREEYDALPSELVLREIKIMVLIAGMRTRSVILVTSLLDADLFTAEELAELYLWRWKVELFFDDIKTSMAMDVLRCKSPQMVHKELCMHLIAYNLIRSLMAEVSALHQVDLWRISFKGTADRVRQWAWLIAMTPGKNKRRKLIAELFATIAADPVPLRPQRREPRVRKRRPKPFALMTQPRHSVKEIPHRNTYRVHPKHA